MHLRRTRFSNFYDDAEEEDAGSRAEVAGRVRGTHSPPAEPLAAPSPAPYPVHPAPRASHPSGRSQAAAQSCARVARELLLEREPARSISISSSNSASIEDIIDLDATSAARSATPDGYVSLRRLQDSVEEAVRDVRRLDALMRRAIWHALTLRHANKDVRPRHGRLGQSTHRSGSEATATVVTDTTAVLHARPFLPPDRYPTLPRLRDEPEHIQRNLSRALFAAQRAGLFERQRAWLQRRAGAGRSGPSVAYALPSSASSAAAPTPLTNPASLRRTALQRIASLSSAPAARKSPARIDGTTVSATQAAEERVQSSVSLLVLRVAKDRAVATVFLRVLRLELYQRRARDNGVELRYRYYLQRRVLRQWSRTAAAQHRRHHAVLTAVVAHWQRVVRRQRALRSVLQAWRRGLQARYDALVALQRARRERCFLQWRLRLTLHRERVALYDAADNFAAARQPRGTSADVWVLLHGQPHAPRGGGGTVVTAARPRLLLQRLFSQWRQRTEIRLTNHLAVWQYTQQLRARVVRRLCSAARRVALQHHRLELQHAPDRYVTTDVPASHDVSGGGAIPATCQGAPRPALRVCEIVAPPAALRKYKASAARSLANAAGRRRCFDHWRRRLQAHRADRFHLQCVYANTVRRWLHTLALHREARQEKRLVLHRWAAAALEHRTAAVADGIRQRQLAGAVLRRWRGRLQERATHHAMVVHTCLRRWWTRAMLRRAVAVLQEVRRRSLLRQWHRRAITSARVRTNEYVAETISETARVLACFRRWRLRAADRGRVRLAWDVLTQLRRERLCRHSFDVWRRRTFGPAPPRQWRSAPAEDAPPASSRPRV